MRTLETLIVSAVLFATQALGQDPIQQARNLEAEGNAAAAIATLREAASKQAATSSELLAYAEFLDRYGHAGAREEYRKLLSRLDGPGSGQMRAKAARRLIALDLLAGDRASAAEHLNSLRASGADPFPEAPAPAGESVAGTVETTSIPGPLEGFARMAAISSSIPAAEILPALARNVIISGYRVGASYEGLEPTEYMKLLNRYLSQAGELESLSNDSGFIVIEECDSAETGDLLRVLGYRMRGGCGSEVILETVNASRAFLTIDAGFPLAELEQSLRTNRPFRYDYNPTRVPVLYGENYWVDQKERDQRGTFLNAFLADPSLCRLYLALSKMDQDTVAALRKEADLETLRAFAHVLDFFGTLFEIQDGRAVVPGGATTAPVWEKLAGASPNKGGEFYLKLIARDDGWLASYYDSLHRLEEPVLRYLADPARMERFYLAIRGRVTSPGPARPVFRSNADLMLLATGLRLEPDGRPHLPGSIEVWKNLFANSPHKAYDEKLKKTAPRWSDEDDVVEALFALCRKLVENDPLKIFLVLSDINRVREAPLKPETADRLARDWGTFGDQYSLFAETGALRDETIIAFLDSAEGVSAIGNKMMRADTAGALQALTGLWQIAVRHGSIPEEKADQALADILAEFDKKNNRRELFDSMRNGVEVLLAASNRPPQNPAHDHILNVLAGDTAPKDVETHQTLVDEMRRIFLAQRLIPVDDLLELARHLEELANGGEMDTALINRLQTRLDEFVPHREGLSQVEKSSIAFGYYAERHLRNQSKIDVHKEISQTIGSPDKLLKLRAELASVLRDTLVGYNYIHYAPPGAQLLRTNPLFVRGHDFLGVGGAEETWREAEVYGTGWPSSAGGRLVGSLAGLPYALAQAEQNFLVPRTEQALIWADLVPQMMLMAKVPRWWKTPPELLHWTAMHVRLGRNVVAEAALDGEMEQLVASALAERASPARSKRARRALRNRDVPAAIEQITTTELFAIGADAVEKGAGAPVIRSEIERLAKANPEAISYKAVSRALGTPKPRIAHSYRPELLDLRTFPTLMGHSSRIMAESWESNLLYFATLADELHLRPSQLNVKVPEWTQATVETIFATHLEDWPAVLRSLRAVGDQLRAEARETRGAVERASIDR